MAVCFSRMGGCPLPIYTAARREKTGPPAKCPAGCVAWIGTLDGETYACGVPPDKKYRWFESRGGAVEVIARTGLPLDG